MHVAPAVPAFLKRYPELSIDISLSPAYVDLVDEGLDLAIRIGALEDSALVVRKLALSRLSLLRRASLSHGTWSAARAGRSRRPQLSLRRLSDLGRRVAAGRQRGEVRVTVSGSFRSNNAELLRAAALEGIGIAALPTWVVAEQLRSGMLRRVLTAWEAPVSTIYAVYPGNRLMSMKVRAFVDHLARCFGRTPYWDGGL